MPLACVRTAPVATGRNAHGKVKNERSSCNTSRVRRPRNRHVHAAAVFQRPLFECAFGKRGALRHRSVRGLRCHKRERSPPRTRDKCSQFCVLLHWHIARFYESDLQITIHHVRLDISLDHSPIKRILVIIEFELKSTESAHMWLAARYRQVTRRPCRPCGRGKEAGVVTCCRARDMCEIVVFSLSLSSLRFSP